MARLTVNVSDGSIEIEGEESFILTAFDNVRAALKEMQPPSGYKLDPIAISETLEGAEPANEPKAAPKAKPAAAKGGGASKKPQPVLNPNLNLSKLSDFTKRYRPTKNTERILVFSAFLRDELNISPCPYDDIYSCFHSLKSEMKIPQAFSKNMNDTKNEGFIDYSKLSEITIPTMGENHLVHMEKMATKG